MEFEADYGDGHHPGIPGVREIRVGAIQCQDLPLEQIEGLIRRAGREKVTVVCLPECAHEGRESEPEALVVGQTLTGPFGALVSGLAIEFGMVVVGDVVEKDGASLHNTAFVTGVDGRVVGKYRKVHFPAGEGRSAPGMVPGRELPVFDIGCARAGIQICYDNYFPETCRELALAGAEIVFFPHNEHHAWHGTKHVSLLARARALENCVFVVPAGPSGEIGTGGYTGVIGPAGDWIALAPQAQNGVLVAVNVDLNRQYRLNIDSKPDGPDWRNQKACFLSAHRRPDVYARLGKPSVESVPHSTGEEARERSVKPQYSKPINVRTATVDDRNSIEAITMQSWEGVSGDQLFEKRYGKIRKLGWKERKTGSVLRSFDVDPGRFFVAEVESETVGYASWNYRVSEETGQVGDNAVLPEYRGRGVGRALHERVLDHLESLGAKIIQVGTLDVDIPAQRMYRRAGFRELVRSVTMYRVGSAGTGRAD